MLTKLRNLRHSTALLSWANLALGIGSSIILLPLLIAKLSVAQLAVYYLLQMLFGLGGLVDFGFGDSVARAAAYFGAGMQGVPREAREFKKANEGPPLEPNVASLLRLKTTSSRMFTGLGLLAMLFGGGVGVLLFRNAMALAGNGNDLWAAFGLTLVAVFLGFKVTSYASMANGLLMVRDSIKISLWWNVARFALAAGGLLAGWGVAGTAFATMVANFGIYLSQRRQVLRWFGGVLRPPSHFDHSLVKNLWPATWRSGGTSLGAYLINYSSGWVVAQIPNAALIASFLLTSRILIIISRFAETPLNVKIPLLTKLRAHGDRDAFVHLAFHRISLALFIMIGGIVSLHFMGPWLIGFLHRDTKLIRGPLYWIIAGTILLETHHVLHTRLYITTNHVPFFWPAVVSGVAIVGLGAATVKTYGIFGPVCAQMVIQLLLNNWYPVFLNLRNLNVNFINYVRYLVSAFLPAGIDAVGHGRAQ